MYSNIKACTLLDRNIKVKKKIDSLRKFPETAELLSQKVNVWRDLTLEEHLFLVIDQYYKYFAKRQLGLKRSFMLKLLLLHDIGKPKAVIETGNKDNQYTYSAEIIHKIGHKYFSHKKQILVGDVLKKDTMGNYFKGRINLYDTLGAMLDIAEANRVSLKSVFKIYFIYFQCDLSAYTEAAAGNYKQENEGFGGMPALDKLFKKNKQGKIQFNYVQNRFIFNDLYERRYQILADAVKYFEIKGYRNLKKYMADYDRGDFFSAVLSQTSIRKRIEQYIEKSPKLIGLSSREKSHLTVSLLIETYYYTKFSENKTLTIDILKDYLNSDNLREIIKLNQIRKYKRKNFNSYTNLVKAQVILSAEQKEAYLQFCENEKFPVYIEDFLTSDIFFNLFKNITQDYQQFIQETLLVNKWFLFKERHLEDNDLCFWESELFRAIQVNEPLIMSLRKEYFRNKARFNNSKKTSKIRKKYELKTIPGEKYTIEELFNFINSDNFSIFSVFSYANFIPSQYSYIRSYHGLPLTILHGTRAHKQVAESGAIIPGGSSSGFFHTATQRNKKYIFFGALWDHICRTPACREIDPLFKFYGDVVIEFPFSAISDSSKQKLKLRGAVFQTFESNLYKDEAGHSIPYDIVEGDRANLPLTEAVRIYCSTSQQEVFWNNYKKDKNLSFEVVSADRGNEVALKIYNEAKEIVDNYCINNPGLIKNMTNKQKEIEKFIFNNLSSEFEKLPREAQSWFRMFIHECSCVSFSDFI